MKTVKDFPSFTITLLEPGIAHVAIKEIKEIRLQDNILLYDELEKIGNGNKIGILTTFKNFVPPNKQAMKYASSARLRKLLYASAIVVDSIALHVVMMMFMGFNKHPIPRKTFNGKREALQWLIKMRDRKKNIE